MKLSAFSLAALLAVAVQPAHSALVFNITPTGNAEVDAGFQRAAAVWSNIFVDPVTINVRTSFDALSPGVAGQATISSLSGPYSLLRDALVADASSADDQTFTNSLPTGPSFNRYIRSGLGPAYVQTISRAETTRANAKALGLTFDDYDGEDTFIEMSSLFDWDFDPSDGIAVGKYDFVSIAVHELGHAMGFFSGVDVADNTLGDSETGEYTTLLDFTRCSAASVAAGARVDMRTGRDAKDFAIDANCTPLVSNAWSTGMLRGDGRQASHWRFGAGIGVMTAGGQPAGVLNPVLANDIRALDVIGWTLRTAEAPPNGVPLPGTLWLGLLALAGVAQTRFKRSAGFRSPDVPLGPGHSP